MPGTPPRIYIGGIGLLSPAGLGVDVHRAALLDGARCIRPLSLFPASDPLPVGQVTAPLPAEDAPRAHLLALAAAREALGDGPRPDAIILGGTTGGISTSEILLKEARLSPELVPLHGTGTVATWLASKLGCMGPALTVSTACSSGAVALTIARRMIIAGEATRVLAGGVDALCRLTYHGFRLLQLIDPHGTRPLSEDRAGMTVGEGAAMLLLTSDRDAALEPLVELLGGGLSCDGYHPSAPHPDGLGALDAMRGALDDAGRGAGDVDYINLHGTGTRNNDSSEAAAVRALFPDGPPPLSSTKGSFGHALAASGALEAGLAAICIQDGIFPGNVGGGTPDPALGLSPILTPRRGAVGLILSNSFGFGGNNAALVLGTESPQVHGPRPTLPALKILGLSLLSGAGHTNDTLARLSTGEAAGGVAEDAVVTQDLPPRSLRRMKSLPRGAIALASSAAADAGTAPNLHGIYLGTGWGALSETCDFLQRLFDSGEEFSSPTDFVGSVHNAVAAQLAIRMNATGPNITATDGDLSFGAAAYMAALLADKRDLLLCGLDEHHEVLSPVLDPTADAAGGGALILRTLQPGDAGPFLLAHQPRRGPNRAAAVLADIGGAEGFGDRFAAVFLDAPRSAGEAARNKAAALLTDAGFQGPVISTRDLLGEYATASAAATALAASYVRTGAIPEALTAGRPTSLDATGILVLTIGETWQALEVQPGL